MSQEIRQITVRHTSAAPIREIGTAPALDDFQRHWSSKIRTDDASDTVPLREFAYRLDLRTPQRSERWLYHPDGRVVVLSKMSRPVYRIADVPAFNRVLGIQSR